MKLLKQGVAYQIEFSRHHPKNTPQVSTILEDYTPFLIPNTEKARLTGHTANVKCIEFLGENWDYLASGSSDNTVKIWDVPKGTCQATLTGHTSRIWDLSSTNKGVFVASASGDGTVRVRIF